MFKEKGVWPRRLPIHLFYRKTTPNQVTGLKGQVKTRDLVEKPWSPLGQEKGQSLSGHLSIEVWIP